MRYLYVLILTIIALPVFGQGAGTPSNEELIKQAKEQIEIAVSEQNYAEAARLQKEIEIREQIELAVTNEDYTEAARLKKSLENKDDIAVEEDVQPVVTEVKANESNAPANVSPQVEGPGYAPPSEGKAVIYMLRVSALGFAINFEYFHENQFIGQSKGVSYIRYEVDPGEHLFWASAENQHFITVNAEAGKTYFMYIDVVMGMWKAQVNLSPVLPSQNDRIQRGMEVINKHKASISSAEIISKKMNKLNSRGFIENKLNAYETKWKSTKGFASISSEMNIPSTYLK